MGFNIYHGDYSKDYKMFISSEYAKDKFTAKDLAKRWIKENVWGTTIYKLEEVIS